MVRLADYIDRGIDGASFGESIELFVFGFEIAELEGWGRYFTSLSNHTSYRPKQKTIISVGQLNWPDVKDLDEQAQFDRFADTLLSAVARVASMKRKPKSFEVHRFLVMLQSILAACPVTEITMHTP